MTIGISTFENRDMYHSAWKYMYHVKPSLYTDKIYTEVNPLQNKELGTEQSVVCSVAFDVDFLKRMSEEEKNEFLNSKEQLKAARLSGLDITKTGLPVGIQSWVVTSNKIIGKQMIVSPEYSGKGICSAMLLADGNLLKGATKITGDDFEYAYIGCSQYSKPIIENIFGIEAFSSSVENDMYKFNVPVDMLVSDDLKDKIFKKKEIKDLGHNK